jgi:hypothetical protein
MKQRKTMIAAWTALLVAIGIVLAVVIPGNSSSFEEGRLASPKILLKPGERRAVAIRSDAVEVRLFVEGLPFRETPHAQALMNDIDGIPLSMAQRDILDHSLARYRQLPTESGATPACYDPHHIFRYFNAAGEEIGKLEVCYCCRQVRVYGLDENRAEGEIWQFDFEGVGAMLKAMKVPTDINCSGRG